MPIFRYNPPARELIRERARISSARGTRISIARACMHVCNDMCVRRTREGVEREREIREMNARSDCCYIDAFCRFYFIRFLSYRFSDDNVKYIRSMRYLIYLIR